MISIKEQSILSDELIDTLGIDEYLPSLTSGEVLSPQKLGLSIGVDRNIWSSYYIGVTKFSKDVLAVIPKVVISNFAVPNFRKVNVPPQKW